MSHGKFALVFPPNFGRGMAAIAFAKYCYDNGFRPEVITGCSAGALAGASVVGWDEIVMEKSWDVWSGLKPGDLSSLKFADDALLASLGIAALLHLMPPLFSGKKAQFVERLAKAGITLAMITASVKAVLRQDSIYSNQPLYNLLKRNLVFRKIFSSPIKLIVTSAGYQGGERVINTNFLEEDRNDDEKLLHGLLASAGIVPLLPPDYFGGMPRVDGIFSTEDFLAIDLVEEYCDCEKIFICIFYWLPKIENPRYWPDIGEHTGELLVRDKIQAIRDKLPPQTRKKIVLVESEERLPKLQLRDFSRQDSRDYLAMGYMAAENAFKSNPL